MLLNHVSTASPAGYSAMGAPGKMLVDASIIVSQVGKLSHKTV